MSNLTAGQTAQATQASAARKASNFKKIWKHWKWFAGLLVVVVILFGWRSCTAGDTADAVANASSPAQEAQAQAEQAAPSPAQNAPARSERTTTQLTLKEDEWVKVIAYQGQCTGFRIPPGATVAVQAQESDDSPWVDWGERKYPTFHALRFKGTAVTVVQGPTMDDGSCKY